MTGVTTHVLDTACGKPAQGVRVQLQRNVTANVTSAAADGGGGGDDYTWEHVGETVTNSDGRGSSPLIPPTAVIEPGIYKAIFYVRQYFESSGTVNFYPKIEIIFRIADVTQHYHIPLLLSPFGYSTYRGS